MLIQNHRLRGWWDETLFPMLKDIARYGADKLLDQDTVHDATQVAVDAATMALSKLIPGIAPVVNKVGSMASDQAADTAA